MSRSKGFSLVELAVALAIIALLIAGALIPLSTQMDVRNVADTRRSMESIRDAIIGFAQAKRAASLPGERDHRSGNCRRRYRDAQRRLAQHDVLPRLV